MARNRKATSDASSVRIGPISIFSLIIILCLAVLSVLTIATAQASFALADKQARFNSDTYVNEVAAQEFLADLDAKLASSRASGATHAQTLEAVKKALPEGASIEGDTVEVQFVTDSGRMLTVTLEITSANRYRISQWSATTQWEAQSSESGVWTGSTNQ